MRFLGFALAAMLFASPLPVLAAPIVSVTEGVSTSGLTTFTFNIDPNDFNGLYDTVAAQESVNDGGIFSDDGNAFGVSLFNQVGGITSVGGDDSGIVPTGTLFVAEDTDTAVQGALTITGGNFISTAPFDFATVAFTPDSTSLAGVYSFSFVDNGDVVATVSGSFGEPIPEPATVALVSLGVGCLTRRR